MFKKEIFQMEDCIKDTFFYKASYDSSQFDSLITGLSCNKSKMKFYSLTFKGPTDITFLRMEQIMEKLSNMRYVEKFDIDINDYESKQKGLSLFRSILKTASTLNKLKWLRITLNSNIYIPITDETVDCFSVLNNLETFIFTIKSNQIGSFGMGKFCQGISSLNKVKNLSLKIGSNKIGSKGSRYLEDCFSGITQLEAFKLELFENELIEQDVFSLCQSFGKLTNLISLELSIKNNSIGMLGIKGIGEGLSQLTKLTELSLQFGYYGFGQTEMTALATIIGRLILLTYLELVIGQNNHIGEGLFDLGKNLGMLKNLKKCILCFDIQNNLDSERVKYILQGIGNVLDLQRVQLHAQEQCILLTDIFNCDKFDNKNARFYLKIMSDCSISGMIKGIESTLGIENNPILSQQKCIEIFISACLGLKALNFEINHNNLSQTNVIGIKSLTAHFYKLTTINIQLDIKVFSSLFKYFDEVLVKMNGLKSFNLNIQFEKTTNIFSDLEYVSAVFHIIKGATKIYLSHQRNDLYIFAEQQSQVFTIINIKSLDIIFFTFLFLNKCIQSDDSLTCLKEVTFKLSDNRFIQMSMSFSYKSLREQLNQVRSIDNKEFDLNQLAESFYYDQQNDSTQLEMIIRNMIDGNHHEDSIPVNYKSCYMLIFYPNLQNSNIQTLTLKGDTNIKAKDILALIQGLELIESLCLQLNKNLKLHFDNLITTINSRRFLHSFDCNFQIVQFRKKQEINKTLNFIAFGSKIKNKFRAYFLPNFQRLVKYQVYY